MKKNKFFVLIVSVMLIASTAGGWRISSAQTIKPDLKLTAFSVTPIQPVVNQATTIKIDGIYNGITPLYSSSGLQAMYRTFGDIFYDSSKPSIVPQPSQADPLEPGETFSYYYYGSFPSAGERRLKFEIDYLNELDESNESNNKLETAIIVLSPSDTLDLSLTSITVSPSDPIIGQTTTITVNGRYEGNTNLLSGQGISSTKAELTDFNLTTGDIKPQPVPSINSPMRPGAVFTYTLTGSFKAEGDKTLTFTVDRSNELRESNENNNSIQTAVTVTQATTTPASEEPPVSDDANPLDELPREEDPRINPPGPDDSDETPDSIADDSEVAQLERRLDALNLELDDNELEVEKTERDLTTKIDDSLTSRLAGKILLQVENAGQAWYLDPISDNRYYLADGDTAYQALRAFGLGITNGDLAKLPVGIDDRAEGLDSDDDGLIDRLEESLDTDIDDADSDDDGVSDGNEIKARTNPDGKGLSVISASLAARLEGRILLQVEKQGQAWYIHNGQRYYMPDGEQAYQIMRFLSLGINNTDLRKIAVGSLAP